MRSDDGVESSNLHRVIKGCAMESTKAGKETSRKVEIWENWTIIKVLSLLFVWCPFSSFIHSPPFVVIISSILLRKREKNYLNLQQKPKKSLNVWTIKKRIFLKAAKIARREKARQEEDNVTRNARETRDNDGELMPRQHTRLRIRHIWNTCSDLETDFNVVRTKMFFLLLCFLPCFFFGPCLLWCVLDHRIEVIKVQ